jgi:hypothetical protein
MRQRDGFDCVIARDLRVAMRDGVPLATDLYQPAREGEALPGPWPALLVRTPYNKGDRPIASAMLFARHGYVVTVQDCRGRFGLTAALIDGDLHVGTRADPIHCSLDLNDPQLDAGP